MQFYSEGLRGLRPKKGQYCSLNPKAEKSHFASSKPARQGILSYLIKVSFLILLGPSTDLWLPELEEGNWMKVVKTKKQL